MHSCRVVRGQDCDIELVSCSCKGRCSYVLKFPTPAQTEDWYQVLRKEAAQSADEEDGGYVSLDSVLLDADRVRADSLKYDGATGVAPKDRDSIFKFVTNWFRAPRKTSLSYPQGAEDNDTSWDDEASRWSWPLDA